MIAKSMFVLFALLPLYAFAQSGPVRIENLQPVKRIEPKWDGRIEGIVKLDVVVDAAGSVIAVHPVEGDPKLIKMSQAAVRQWKFLPRVADGPSATAVTMVTLIFRRPVPEDLQDVCSVMDAEVVQTSEDGSKYLCVPWKLARPHVVKWIAPKFPEGHWPHTPIEYGAVVRVLIGTDGKVQRLELLHGHPDYREPAKFALQQWEFKPFLAAGKAYPAWILIICDINCYDF